MSIGSNSHIRSLYNFKSLFNFVLCIGMSSSFFVYGILPVSEDESCFLTPALTICSQVTCKIPYIQKNWPDSFMANKKLHYNSKFHNDRMSELKLSNSQKCGI